MLVGGRRRAVCGGCGCGGRFASKREKAVSKVWKAAAVVRHNFSFGRSKIQNRADVDRRMLARNSPRDVVLSDKKFSNSIEHMSVLFGLIGVALAHPSGLAGGAFFFIKHFSGFSPSQSRHVPGNLPTDTATMFTCFFCLFSW